MAAPSLSLRPGLPLAQLRQTFEAESVVQVAQVLPDAAADALTSVLERGVRWSLVRSGPSGEAVITPPEQLASPTPELRAELRAVVAAAAQRFSYLYLTYPMIDAYLDGRDPGHPLNALTEFLNGPEFLTLARAIAGPRVTKVDAQATCYRPGHFLTQHDDLAQGERVAAYTLSLTRRWRPDWGGQLLFHTDDGDIARGFAPQFNTLTVFRVPLQHSVAPVAAYAAASRFMITGWFRSDPPLTVG